MKMQAKILALASLVATAGVVSGQNYLADSSAAINMNNTIQGGPGGAPPFPGNVPGVNNPGAGYQPGPMGGNTAPGYGDPSMDPALAGDPALLGGNPYGNQQNYVATPAPIPTENVLVGRRVYDAVSGALLEDAIEIAVRKSDVDVYPDDGIHDNGIKGDGIRGNVETSNKQFIGQFSNTAKDKIVHGIQNAENIDPMVYYGYHIAKLGGHTQGPKRYGRPLPGEKDQLLVAIAPTDMPDILDLEDNRDELVRQWNQDFLAKYRVTPEDPQSEYFPIYVPSPPLTPSGYPVPNGYTSPQSVALAATSQAEQSQAAAAATLQQQKSAGRGSNGGGDPAMGGGI